MKMQTILDTAVLGVIAQGEPSMHPVTGSCMYRGPDGLKCAAGHLISDDDYLHYIEGTTAGADEVALILPKGRNSRGTSVDLAEALQSAHDGPARIGHKGETFIAAFKENVERVAHRFNLKVPAYD